MLLRSREIRSSWLLALFLTLTSRHLSALKQVDDPSTAKDPDDNEPDDDDANDTPNQATAPADQPEKSTGIISRAVNWYRNNKKSTDLLRNPFGWIKEKRISEKEIKAAIKPAIRGCLAQFNETTIKALVCDKGRNDKHLQALVKEVKKLKWNKAKIRKLLSETAPGDYEILREGAGYAKCVVDTAAKELNCTHAVQEYDVGRKIQMDLCGISGRNYLLKRIISRRGLFALSEMLLVEVLCLTVALPICLVIKTVSFLKDAIPFVFEHFVGHRCSAFVNGN